jgi:hypothetical protein
MFSSLKVKVVILHPKCQVWRQMHTRHTVNLKSIEAFVGPNRVCKRHKCTQHISSECWKWYRAWRCEEWRRNRKSCTRATSVSPRRKSSEIQNTPRKTGPVQKGPRRVYIIWSCDNKKRSWANIVLYSPSPLVSCKPRGQQRDRKKGQVLCVPISISLSLRVVRLVLQKSRFTAFYCLVHSKGWFKLIFAQDDTDTPHPNRRRCRFSATKCLTECVKSSSKFATQSFSSPAFFANHSKENNYCWDAVSDFANELLMRRDWLETRLVCLENGHYAEFRWLNRKVLLSVLF